MPGSYRPPQRPGRRPTRYDFPLAGPPRRRRARPGYDAPYRHPARGRRAYDAGRPGPRAPWERYRPAPPDPFGRRRAYDAGRPDMEPWRERWERVRERVREEERRRGWVGHARRFARRYRQPIIGLAVAGAAAPIARAGREAPPAGAREAVQPTAARAAAGGLEEEVGRRWAAERAEAVRADTIRGAMMRYGIDRDLAADIYDAAIANDIEPEVAYGLVNTESAFKHRAVSHVGARGLTQVMPRTAEWLQPGTTAEDLFDRTLNLDMGFGYLRDLIDKYDGNLRLALLAYNRGPGTVDRVLSQGGDPDNGYADMVLSG